MTELQKSVKENKRLVKIIWAKDDLLVAYRLNSNERARRAIDKLDKLGEVPKK